MLVVRKLGLPWQPELAMGAIASGGALVLNDEVVRHLGGHSAAFDAVRAREQVELERRERDYRGDRPPLGDARPHRHPGRRRSRDGCHHGSRGARAAVARRARASIVAVPVASPEARDRIAAVADEVVCLAAPMFFSAVGQWYADFGQTEDDEVRDLLARAHATLGRNRDAAGR